MVGFSLKNQYNLDTLKINLKLSFEPQNCSNLLSIFFFLDSLTTISTLYAMPYGLGAAVRLAPKQVHTHTLSCTNV